MSRLINFDKLLSDKFGTPVSVLNQTLYNFTEVGENYGSQMLGLNALIEQNENGVKKRENLQLIAKTYPEHVLFQEIFSSDITFKTETDFYAIILPKLNQFLEENNVENQLDQIFAQYYGSRISLQENATTADKDAVLLLENLKPKGFLIGDRLNGYDVKVTEYIIKKLALFNAVPLAFKIKDKNGFHENILPFVPCVRSCGNKFEILHQQNLQVIIEEIAKVEYCKPYLAKIKNFIENCIDLARTPVYDFNEPFGTLIHSDFWVNNILLNMDHNGIPKAMIMIDFQCLQFGSPARDLIFFLCTSVQNKVLEEHYNHFLRLYHDELLKWLDKFGIDTNPFSFDRFITDIDKAVKAYTGYQALFMLRPIFADKSSIEKSAENVFQRYESGMYSKFETLIKLFINNKWI